MRLAGPRRPDEDHVLLPEEEVETGQVQHELRLQRALETPIELLERLAGGQARLPDARLAAVSLARAALGLKERLGEALARPLFRMRRPRRAERSAVRFG